MGLWGAIPGLEAEAELRWRAMKSPLTADRLFDLIFLATGDRDLAEKAFIDMRSAELRSGQMPSGYMGTDRP